MVDIKNTNFFKSLIGGRKRMDLYEHEKTRFEAMSLQQLITRLGRITQPDKLKMFIIVAGEYGYLGLREQAQKKLMELIEPGSNPTLKTIRAMPNPIPKTSKVSVKQTNPKIEAPVVLRRHLEF